MVNYWERDNPDFERDLYNLEIRSLPYRRYVLHDFVEEPVRPIGRGRGQREMSALRRETVKELFRDSPIGNVFDMPWQIKECLYGHDHLNNRQRFITVVFLLNNAIPPAHVRRFFSLGKYDKEAWNQIEWLLNKYRSGDWNYKSWLIKDFYN